MDSTQTAALMILASGASHAVVNAILLLVLSRQKRDR